MKMRLFDSCVYTIATPEHLLDASQTELPLHEGKRWVKALDLLIDARDSGCDLPIVFADSRYPTTLIGWSVVRSISVSATGTDYTIDSVWGIPPSRPQDLQRLDSADYIAEGHIRPYVLCQTPAFLFRQAKKPHAWTQLASIKQESREGKRRVVAHMRLERSPVLIAALKKQWMEQYNGRLPCEVCGFDFLENYGPVGAGFAEAHHKTALAESPKGGRITSLRDLTIVCSNCHSMLHRSPEFPNIESLRNCVRHAKRKVV